MLARTPAIHVHGLPERIIGLFSPFFSTEQSSDIGTEDAGKRTEISRIGAGTGGTERLFALLKGFDAGLQFVTLIGVAVGNGNTGGHEYTTQITHLW
ncbi:unnamed protein product [Lactuca virosa]|uniref:Uncharacterized protein n=1 Tax=Lactuca virosa TaxID=75947 RepID=A0AAU9LMJ4_9ASTR|nr:unnamed protein product [Lactuca virosa]